jgi:hypothetical protein
MSARRAAISHHHSPARTRVYAILEQALPDDQLSRLVHAILIILALFSVSSVVLESVPSLRLRF